MALAGPMDRGAFLADVRARVAFEDQAQARRSVESVLAVLGARLFDNDARVVARRLPADWASLLLRDGPEESFDLDELFRRVANADGIELGRAVERTQVICQVLAERLDEEARTHLGLRLPESLAELFTPRAPIPTQPVRGRVPAPVHGEEPRHTLASGRPGSQNPLADGRPVAGQTHSIAASSNPHADSKLSTARGISTERDGESLAAGAPEHGRSLADRDEDSD